MNRPRGLCWYCFYTPGVKDLYPSANKEGLGTMNVIARLPVPTRWLPGTRGKLAAIMYRAENNLALFHPEDARHE